jgi:Glycosyltransferase Family 4
MLAWWWYNSYKKENKIDIIIDEAGGWPLLSPLYAKSIPIYFFVHHIAEKEFDIAPYPLSRLIRWCYNKMLQFYKNTATIAVSNSTRDDLVHDL